MKLKIAFVLIIIFLAFFPVNVAAATCYTAEEQEAEFEHKKDTSLFFVAMDSEFFRQSVNRGIYTYAKGTTKLIFDSSTYLTASPPSKNIHFSKYNNADNYTKLTEITDSTVGDFTAYYLEYQSKSNDDKGRLTIIIGNTFESFTKVYSIDLKAKDVRFDSEKELYLKMIDSFSLSPLEECTIDDDSDDTTDDSTDDTTDDTTDDSTDDTTNDTTDDTTDDTSDSDTDTTNDITAETDVTDDDAMDEGSSSTSTESFKLFGFDGVLVIAAVIVVLLLLAVGLVGLVIVVVVVYFFFIKKKH